MRSAAPSIGKGPSIQGPLSGHSGHGRTRCWPAPVAIDPEQTLERRAQLSDTAPLAGPMACDQGRCDNLSYGFRTTLPKPMCGCRLQKM